jgi:DNA-binding NtrC family response regulator
MRVLCVDDRSQLLQIRKDILERLGFSVITARSVPSALAAVEDPAVAAVLLEYKSEGIDAEAVALHIKTRFPDVPIVLLSAYSDMPERVLWLVDEYVMRSQPVEKLAKTIERVTKSSKRFRGGSPGEAA